MERRNFIRLAGGGVVLAARAGWGAGLATGLATGLRPGLATGLGLLGGCSLADVPPGAVAAWQGPAAAAELRHWVLAYALLAPNPHNQQPWLADLRTPGSIVLRLDMQRLLPATDPFGRQILLGAGAFLALLTMAAAERGQRTDVALFPDGEPGAQLDDRPFARVRLVADATVPRDPLFAQVLARRTDRRAYDPARPIAAADVQRLQAAASGLALRFGVAGVANGTAAERARLDAIRQLVREAWRIELTTEPAMMESLRLLRVGSAEIDQHRDGISITSPLLLALVKTGLFDRRQFPAAESSATSGQIRDFDAITASTPAYLWLVSQGNRRAQQIDAGRAYLRINLAASAAGLALHPNQQALQEVAEVAAPYRALHALLDAPAPGHTVQMLARLGYLPAGTAAPGPAPRRGLARQLAL